MPEWEDDGVVLSARRHGEHGAVATLLTRARGRAAGYVYGAASASTRAALEPGTCVQARWQAKTSGQLGSFSLEIHAAAVAVMDDARRLTALQAALALLDATLAEGESHPALYDGTVALLRAFAVEDWPAVYVRWEIGLLQELGFGLDLARCAISGATEGLAYVSPKSGAAVTEAAGAPWREKLLPLPQFLRGGKSVSEADVAAGLALTGHFLRHRVFAAAHADLPEPRRRLEGYYNHSQ